MRPKSLPHCPRPVGPQPWQPPSGPVVSWSPCPSDLSPLPLFQEKNLGPSRRAPGTPRPPGVSKGGRIPPQHGGRAGMGRTSRSWEDSPGEQPRGGAGGRGRRGRGRGSPHLSGGGDASTADRKSKVGAEGADVCLKSVGEAQCCPVALSVLLTNGFSPSSIVYCLSFLFWTLAPALFHLFPLLLLPPRPALWSLSLSVSHFALCCVLGHLPSLPFVSFWWYLVGSVQRACFAHSCVRAHVLSLCHSLN